MDQGAHGSQFFGIGITLLIAVLVMAMRNRRPRRLRLEALWMRPAIFLLLIAATFVTAPPRLDAAVLSVLGLALVFGVATGWLRGSLMHIEVHPETHDLSARASTLGMVFILAVLVLRTTLRDAAQATPVAGLSAAAVADALILFAGAMMITQSLEMWLRAGRLLNQARAAKAAAVSPGANPPIVS